MSEKERPKFLENEGSKIFDALLVHVYGYKEYPNERLRPSTNGRLQVRAAAELFCQGLVKNIVLAGGKIWGENYPSVSTPMKDELKRRFQIPEENIHLIEKAKDTDAEIDSFLEKAKEMGWTNLLDISVTIHKKSVETLLRRKHAEIETISTQEILSEISPRYAEFNKRLSRSARSYVHRVYEGARRLVMIIDREGRFLGKIAKITRTKRYRGIEW